MHLFFIGILLGLGAAIPIGPVNLEMIRRHLRLGLFSGVSLGIGACCADVTYIVLLYLGIINLLSHPMILSLIGMLGAIILLWFGYGALSLPLQNNSTPLKQIPLWRHYLEGYLMTLLNPYTILFWTSISAQIASLSASYHTSLLYPTLGVLFGTLSWVIGLNTGLWFTKHRLSEPVIHRLNRCGGIILIGFGIYSFIHSVLLF
ncbi:MAG: LysE family translocator [Legionellales bacterium]|nr:LysE family translocator [Legionellales bacterium]